jgi:hypothetical protein
MGTTDLSCLCRQALGSILVATMCVAVPWITVLLMRDAIGGLRWDSLSGDTYEFIVVTIFASVLCFALAHFFVRNTYGRVGFFSPPIFALTTCITYLSIVAAIGSFLISFEFSVIRGYGFGTSINEIRSLEVTRAQFSEAPSVISGLGRLMTPALLVAILLVSRSWSQLRRKLKLVFFASLLTVLTQQALFEGGRFFPAVALLVALIGYFSSPKIDLARTNWRPVFVGIIAGVFALVAFGLAFILRVDADVGYGTIFFNYNYLNGYPLEVSRETADVLDSSNGSVAFPALMLWHYCVQGIGELGYLYTVSDRVSLANGAYQFPQVFQIMSMLGLPAGTYFSFFDLDRVGTYPTLLGAAILDFGLNGAFMFVQVVAVLSGAAHARHHRWDPLALAGPFLICQLLFAPVLSLMPLIAPTIFHAVLAAIFLRLMAKRHSHLEVCHHA